MMPVIERVAATPDVADEQLPRTVAQQCGTPLVVASKEELVARMSDYEPRERFPAAKRTLFFTRNKGRFLKKCPGSRGVLCCNYYTINSVTGCPYDCSYCILQHYIANNPFITVFLNREQVFTEMRDHLRTAETIRVGTGELADSLALDNLIDETGFFMEGIVRHGLQDSVVFEFKTKSARVDGLIARHREFPDVRVVAGFSVNIPEFTASDELHTASIKERRAAIAAVIDAGIPVAIHFDPVVMVPRLFDAYRDLVRQLFSQIERRHIAWISMGGFRHSTAMTQILRKRFPGSVLLEGEMFPGDTDGKMRYLAPVRRRFYRMLRHEITALVPDPPLYMCMEKSFMWNDINMDVKVLRNGSLSGIFQ